jgi:hypothetical protein
MENIVKLRNAITVFESELNQINQKLRGNIGLEEKMKLDHRKMEVLVSIENLKKYIKRLEFVEKVKEYENSSRNAQR